MGVGGVGEAVSVLVLDVEMERVAVRVPVLVVEMEGVAVRVPVLVVEMEGVAVRVAVLVVEMEGVGEGEQLATLAVEPAAQALGQPQGRHEALPA